MHRVPLSSRRCCPALAGKPTQRAPSTPPVDDSTLSVDPSNYLDKHLRDVIQDIERLGEVELIAIGIGHRPR
jgi:hypothetical protein